jgi:hypothetical protein
MLKNSWLIPVSHESTFSSPCLAAANAASPQPLWLFLSGFVRPSQLPSRYQGYFPIVSHAARQSPTQTLPPSHGEDVVFGFGSSSGRGRYKETP